MIQKREDKKSRRTNTVGGSVWRYSRGSLPIQVLTLIGHTTTRLSYTIHPGTASTWYGALRASGRCSYALRSLDCALANVREMFEGKKKGHWIKRGLALRLVLRAFAVSLLREERTGLIMQAQVTGVVVNAKRPNICRNVDVHDGYCRREQGFADSITKGEHPRERVKSSHHVRVGAVRQ